MHALVSRRAVLLAAPVAGLGVLGLDELGLAAGAQPGGAPGSDARSTFPYGDPALARKAVGFSHANLDGLRELVDRQPELAKASIDWGFGDWESCIGAASHTGNRPIAEYLLAHGATPTIFTFAMLGDLGAVKGMIEAMPGAQRTLGPHGITLYRHALAGDEAAAGVAEYLRGLGDADNGYVAAPLSDEQRQVYLGDYAFGGSADERVSFVVKKPGFVVERPGRSTNRLTHVGDHAFHPAGAPSVRIRFIVEDGRAVRVEFYNPDLLLQATRIPG